jgi:hypothetical protein
MQMKETVRNRNERRKQNVHSTRVYRGLKGKRRELAPVKN